MTKKCDICKGSEKTCICPTHGFCAVCKGPIPKGQFWTFTKKLQRVHDDRDICIANIKENPLREFPFRKRAPRKKAA